MYIFTSCHPSIPKDKPTDSIQQIYSQSLQQSLRVSFTYPSTCFDGFPEKKKKSQFLSGKDLDKRFKTINVS